MPPETAAAGSDIPRAGLQGRWNGFQDLAGRLLVNDNLVKVCETRMQRSKNKEESLLSNPF
jgi:hypothetical protein